MAHCFRSCVCVRWRDHGKLLGCYIWYSEEATAARVRRNERVKTASDPPSQLATVTAYGLHVGANVKCDCILPSRTSKMRQSGGVRRACTAAKLCLS